jgi:ABC-2 type transport system permease protein
VDRLTALVLLRWKSDLRALLWARERLVGLAVLVPGLLLTSAVVCVFAFVGIRGLERARPEELPTILSAVAALVGILWALSPLLSGVAFSETHDLSRLQHFPIPAPLLMASSLVANLVQPLVLSELPLLVTVAAALTRRAAGLPLALAGIALTFVFTLAVAQAVGLVLHGLARNRRLYDRALFVGLALGFAMSALPILLVLGGETALETALRAAVLLEWLPFGWGVRAAVAGGRGDIVPFLAWTVLSGLAIAGAMAVSAGLMRLVYRGELSLGTSTRATDGRARMPLSGPLGTLLEKDLRVAWRDPAVRAGLLMGFVGPLVLVVLLSQARGVGRGGTALLLLASFIGLSGFGSNAFGFERRGIALLLGFPVERWRLLVAKNVGSLVFRAPGLLTVLMVGLVSPPVLLPAAFVIVVGTFLIAAGLDNFATILFPVTVPEPGKNPYGHTSGGRGFGAAVVSAFLLFGAALASAPFAFLAWLPLLLGAPLLWVVALPLSLGGAVAAYAMLVSGAARLLQRREPELIARILGEA